MLSNLNSVLLNQQEITEIQQEQGKESLMNAPLNSVLAIQRSSQMVIDESWMKRIWEWADEFEIPEEDIPRNRDGLLAIKRLSFVMNYWEKERCECVKYKIYPK